MKNSVKNFLESAAEYPMVSKLKYEIAHQFSQAEILNARVPDVIVKHVTERLTNELILGVIERSPGLDLEDETLP